jgi:hypothetical protein
VFIAIVTPAGSADDKLKAREVIAHHLDAVGSEAARAAPRTVKGSCVLTAPSGGPAGMLSGRFRFASRPAALSLEVEFRDRGYPGESFRIEGGKPTVGFVQPGRRSALGGFVSANDVLLREGLLGGVLNAGWPLFAVAERAAKVDYDGLKTLEGQRLHRLRYRAKRAQGDLEVFLYLEPDRFRHVASVHRIRQPHGMNVTIEHSPSEPDTLLLLTETFGAFGSAGRLNLPTSWTIRYEAQARVTRHWKYELVAETVETHP